VLAIPVVEPTIAVLAPHVIDQIAAGEVIERPASVVKELVDNAIDAGATSIAIEVAAGGRALVRVTDDGCGMSAPAAVLSLERHATSKLREVDDLWGIASMGFRGEALPSIASVSRMTITTRRAGDDAATRLVIEAGRLISVTEAGAAVGTTVEVADLLHNLPARLKFLKGEATEASHVTELVAKVAMAYPRLHVKLRHNGRTALDVPPDRDGFARAQALLGPRVASRLVPVNGEEAGVRVTAYLAAPELAQATARGVQLFVGRRPVRDRGLLHALAMGYGELVPRGRYPIAIVLVDVPVGAVDVNVHPQKLEVRFADPAQVAAAVRHVVQAGVNAARWREEAGGAGPVQVQMIASVAPPVLPFDGHSATRLAERHVAQMRSRQVPLGFGLAAEPAPPANRSDSSMATPRDWARSLRDQTRASRAEEPRAAWGTGTSAVPGESRPEDAAEPAVHGRAPGSSGDADRPARDTRGSGSSGDADQPARDTRGSGSSGDADRSAGHAGDSGSSGLAGRRVDLPVLGDGSARGALAELSGLGASAELAAMGASAELPGLGASAELAAMGASAELAAMGASAELPGLGASAAKLSGLGAAAQLQALGASAELPGLGASAAKLPAMGASAELPGLGASAAKLSGLGEAAQLPGLGEAAQLPGLGEAAQLPGLGASAAKLPMFLSAPELARDGSPAHGGFFSALRYLGQLDLTYLACEGDGELVLVDQHAAHERVELARLRARQDRAGDTGDARVAVQNMLFPITFEATPAQLALVARVGDVLSQVGFDVEPFGKTTLAVKAVPANLRHGDPAQLLRALLQQWADAGAPSEADRLDALLGEIACHSVVRAGDRLTQGEAESLLRSLDGIDLSRSAPHGRAVILRLPLTEIGRRFGR